MAGATETGNVQAGLVYSDGTPATGITVYIRPRTFTADTSFFNSPVSYLDSTVTHKSGNFSFKNVDVGSYAIDANDGNSNGVFIDSIVVADKKNPVNIGRDTLLPVGEIDNNGNIFLISRNSKNFYALDDSLNVKFVWNAGLTNFRINEVFGFRIGPNNVLIVSEVDKIRKYSF